MTVVLPSHLREIAKVDGDVTLDPGPVATIATVLEALERAHPALQGTMRDHGSRKRRPFLRFFVNREDWSHESWDRELPQCVANGSEPFYVIGAIAGGRY